ncbi:hypothetical protein CLOLEP_01951 [[Clostridium] leptum DSM 753]|uniref:Uncharacterized protein n=1 Tax=[Clostridium] leptum DSM 753 TaxID=428125 RepID=A7VTQ8_9FIRM|nr:hypothetical protein CLOLEP_01951 [[Clostridium] leptum DSM 753]
MRFRRRGFALKIRRVRRPEGKSAACQLCGEEKPIENVL